MIAAILCTALLASSSSLSKTLPPGALHPRGTLDVPAVTRHATPDHVLLGQPFTYEIRLVHPKEERWELTPPPNLGDFELLGHTRERQDSTADSSTTFKLKLQLFSLGEHRVPSLELSVNDGTKERRIHVEGVAVTGVSSLPQDAEEKGEELRDIKPPVDVPIPSYRLLWAGLGVLGTLALGYALYRFLRQRKSVPAAPVEPPLLLEARTYAALKALGDESLGEQGRSREFYFRLSEILRGYLGERYGFEALECTGPELLTAARGLNTPGLSLEALERFIQDSELAKFANAPMSPEACRASISYAYRLVKDTSPQSSISHASGI